MGKGKKKRVKYDASTRVLCPECGTNVQVGTAGPAGLEQHQGKGLCRDARQKREQQKKTRTLFDFGLKKGKDAAASNPPVAGSSSSKSQLTFPAPIVVQPPPGPSRQ
ncbi:hypothetical protein K443DRAFT_8880 [Laccaria amethystina LaAM-08-1]|uniref:Uncharacterized protein n=1 Tax=Laccaria amethystina LaAM-08-1 TaxID=1095629 RepID=A0A0C9XSI2_9AGAR|nr:hypothetical protein K443DRAFT_8880 [Laccaria amethystina LaAM-08-1]